jgi:hypothetical protein
MSDTKLISIRLPSALLAELDMQAKVEGRSRSQVILRRLSGIGKSKQSFLPESAKGPFLPKPETAVVPSGHCPRDKSHSGFQRPDGFWCVDCRKLY